MKQFKVYTDEQIKLWQRVGLVIEAESEEELRAILNDSKRFDQAMADGRIEYNGDVDSWYETEDHCSWDHDAPTITEIPAREAA